MKRTQEKILFNDPLQNILVNMCVSVCVCEYMCKIIIISGRVHHEFVLAFGEGSTFAGSGPRHQPCQYIIEICDFHLNQKNPKGAPHALVYYIDGVVVKGRIIFATDLFITATQSVTDTYEHTQNSDHCRCAIRDRRGLSPGVYVQTSRPDGVNTTMRTTTCYVERRM